MSWGTMQVGALQLKETDILEDVTNANTGVRTVRWEGRETAPSTATQAAIATQQADIMGLIDRIMSVQFQRKTEYSGFYRFTDTNTQLEKWGEGPAQVRWSLAAEFLGPDNTVDFDSRLANVVRANDFALTGERWHAPASGHTGYFVGSATPTQVVRQTDTGPITVYRSVPAGVNPRWGATVAGYEGGRVRLLRNAVERVSTGIPLLTTDWELNNGLVRIRPASAANTTLAIAFWDGTAWRERNWDVLVAGSVLPSLTHFVTANVIRKDNEVAALRVYGRQPSNSARVLIDLLLRRGARFLEGQVQSASAATLTLTQDTTNAVTDNTSYVISTAADGNGLKMVVGSARNFDPHASGGIERTSATLLDFFLGAEIGAPASGDGATALRDQYIGAMAEKVGVAKR